MQRGHEADAGKVTVPQAAHRLPASRGGSSDANRVASSGVGSSGGGSSGVGSSGTRSSNSDGPAGSAGEQQGRTGQQSADRAEELGGGSAVDRPVVEGEAQGQDRGALRHVSLPPDAVADPADAEDARVARVDHRGE